MLMSRVFLALCAVVCAYGIVRADGDVEWLAQLRPRVVDQAASPPRGWNSYDSYTWTINETQFIANARLVASDLLPFGYDTVVVDYYWYQDMNSALTYNIDKYGRLEPAPGRWPSSANGAGFKEVADQVHALGLKFGIHIMRGMSKATYDANTPVMGTTYTAQDIGVPSKMCPWSSDFMSVNTSHPAGQAFYNSLYQQYAAWGVDFIKNDCVFGTDFVVDEIEAVSAAMDKTGRPMVYSLSPGSSANTSIATHINKLVNMYRVTNDDWDKWADVLRAFPVAANFVSLEGAPGRDGKSWPDLDMLPFGYISTPGTATGPTRWTALTQAEQRTQMTLWCIARSPLIFGGDMMVSMTSAFTKALLTNKDVLAVNADSTDHAPVATCTMDAVGAKEPAHASAGSITQPECDSSNPAWAATAPTSHADVVMKYLAMFNTQSDTAAATVAVQWASLGLPVSSTCAVTDLWTGASVGSFTGSISASIAAHDAVLYLLTCAK